MKVSELEYLGLLADVLEKGRKVPNRTGVDTLSIKGAMMRFNLADGFPLMTTKKVFFKGVVEELLWFIKGSTNANELKEKGVNIWNEWAAPDGELGPIYGFQWRNWPVVEMIGNKPCTRRVDQLNKAIKQLKDNPDSRQVIVSAWNAAQIEQMALPPCHVMFHLLPERLTVEERLEVYGLPMEGDDVEKVLDELDVQTHRLSLALYQRSADLFLGVPFNIASYSLLLQMIAQQTNMVAHEFIHFIGDAHIYENHVEQVQEQLTRKPKELPIVELEAVEGIENYTAKDIALLGYDPHPAIKGEVAV